MAALSEANIKLFSDIVSVWGIEECEELMSIARRRCNDIRQLEYEARRAQRLQKKAEREVRIKNREIWNHNNIKPGDIIEIEWDEDRDLRPRARHGRVVKMNRLNVRYLPVYKTGKGEWERHLWEGEQRHQVRWVKRIDYDINING
jgi:hypothetical protein